MAFASPLQTNSELQWDEDSRPNQPYNCGPSSVEKVSNYYTNKLHYGIEKTRDLGSARNGTGTSTHEQKEMLNARGIPSSALTLTPTQIKKILSTGRRPIVLWLLMEHIPRNIRGHNFTGRHAVSALANGKKGIETGIWINEPNQRRNSPEYEKQRFIPDRYWIPASAAMGRWCIVPDKDKALATRTAHVKRYQVAATVLNVRGAPTATSSLIRRATKGFRFTSNLLEVEGGSYTANRQIRRDWVGFILDRRQVWVARAYVTEVR